MVILITGKKGSGKSHYAECLSKELLDQDYKVLTIDGDSWRQEHSNEDYSDAGRIKNLMTAANKAAEFEENGYIVLVAFIAPMRKWRKMMRAAWRESRLVYMPGGTLWPGTVYEVPTEKEFIPIYGGD